MLLKVRDPTTRPQLLMLRAVTFVHQLLGIGSIVTAPERSATKELPPDAGPVTGYHAGPTATFPFLVTAAAYDWTPTAKKPA